MIVRILLLLPLVIISFCIQSEKVHVIDIIDGDTILTDIGKVRLLGINAPEMGQPCYKESKEFLKRILLGKEVILEFDKYKKDRYGRYLAWVWINDTLVNVLIVKKGYARIFLFGYERYRDEIINAEKYAYEFSNGCLWKKSKYFGCLKIIMFVYDPKGDDYKNLNGEFFEIKNVCNETITMKKWYIFDEANNMFIINLKIDAYSSLRIHTGCGRNNETDVFLCSKKPIWNNDGDTLYLYDSEGKIVLKYSYNR